MDARLFDIKDALNHVNSLIHDAQGHTDNTPKIDEILGILDHLTGVVENLFEFVKYHDNHVIHLKRAP